ncbi:MAG: hypothetical protein Q4C10_11205 [Clostridia bacterium]|nr:hypothetical protein [Clostridia bacterium]
MKRRLAALLAILLALPLLCGAAEASETAELVFSSFEGGGPEYQVAIEDPEIASFACRTEYDDPDGAELLGAGFRIIYTFIGLKPGTTRLIVTQSSPLVEHCDAAYTLAVDEALNVTLSPDGPRVITGFSYFRFGELAYDGYQIARVADGYQVSVNNGPFRKLDPAVADALCQVIETWDLFRWDGFDETQSDVLDGEGFSLEVLFSDGALIRAWGNNAFPEDYFEAAGEMQHILEDIGAAPALTLDGLLDFLAGLVPERRELTVGADVAFGDVTDFYYTYDSSAFPPEYQRYRFYAQGGAFFFYHETREGGRWPLMEEDVTVSGTVELTEAQWAQFCDCLDGGTVRDREERLETGDAGPWLFLYWNGDAGECQEFSFASWEKRAAFEALCEALSDKAQ